MKNATMAARWVETVEPFPPYREGAIYRVRVTDVRKSNRGKSKRGAVVRLEHFGDLAQQGRIDECELLLPIRPAGLMAQLCQACGFDTSAGRTIAPRDVIGWTVGVQFAPNGDGGNWAVVAFKPVVTDRIRSQGAQPTSANAANSEKSVMAKETTQ